MPLHYDEAIQTGEDGLIKYIVEHLEAEKQHYQSLDQRYENHKYPDCDIVRAGIRLVDDILSQQKDNIALIQRVIDKEDALYDQHDKMTKVEDFFKNQVVLFDSAVKFESQLRNDLDYLNGEEETNKALNRIRLITLIPTGKPYDYSLIPELNDLIKKVKEVHDRMLKEKRDDILEIVRQCLEAIHTKAADDEKARAISNTADTFYDQKKEKIAETESLALLDGLVPPMLSYKDQVVDRIEAVLRPEPPKPPVGPEPPKPPKKEFIKAYNRQVVFPTKTLKSEEDIDAYLQNIKKQLEQLMKGCDGIRLN